MGCSVFSDVFRRHANGVETTDSAPAQRKFSPLTTLRQAWFIVLLAPALFGDSVVAVHITALRVPAVVRNGSSTGALLDCEYALGAREQRRLASETGLVVKWFLVGSGPAPVYQWIPGQRPQDFGALRGRVDLAFKVTGSDERGAHRALRIPTPTTDLSGEYKCSVSTFEDEDFMVKRMLVFAPEQSLVLGQYKPNENTVNITCSARGVYPEPKLAIFWSGGDRVGGDISESERAVTPLEGLTTRATLRDGAYDVVASKVLNDGDLPSPTVFDCQLRIAEADYIVRKSLVYYPNGSGPASSAGSRSFWIGSPGIRLAVTMAAVLVIPVALGNLFLDVPGEPASDPPENGVKKKEDQNTTHQRVGKPERTHAMHKPSESRGP